MRHADRWALAPAAPQPDLARVMERVAAVIEGIEPNDSPERFRGLGVDVIFGDGRFVGRTRSRSTAAASRRRAFVIATGSRPAVPPIPGLDAAPYLTNETVFDLREPVPLARRRRRGTDRLRDGAGVSPARAATSPSSTWRRRSCRARTPTSPPWSRGARGRGRAPSSRRDDRRSLRPRRATVRAQRCATPTARRRSSRRSHLLLAARPRTPTSRASASTPPASTLDRGRIVADAGLRTTNPDIYVIGDAAGGYQFTHVAEHHAGIVLRQAIFRMRWAKPSPVVPWCTFTDPELARVGLSETEAKQRGVAHRVYRFPFDDIDRARTEGETEGFAKIVTDPKGKLLGARHRRAACRRAHRRIRARARARDEREGAHRRSSTRIRRSRRSTAASPTSG